MTLVNTMRRKGLFGFRMDMQRSPEQGTRRTGFPELAQELPSVHPVLVASDGSSRPTRPPSHDGLRPGGARARPLQRPLRSRTHPGRRHDQVDQDRSLLRSTEGVLGPLHRSRHVCAVRVRSRPEQLQAGLPRHLPVREEPPRQRQLAAVVTI